MRKKKYLDELVLGWGGKSGDTDDTQKDRDVLENLQPHTDLKKLEIRSYGGTRFPGWLEDLSSLSNLVRLRLLDCGNCLSLPSVEQLPSLQELEIEGFNGVVTVGSKPFPNLRMLRLWSCPEVTGAFMLACFPKLEILTLDNVNVESLHSTTLLSLVHITISSCPNFVCFQDGGLNAPNLETITVITCPKLRSFFAQHMHNPLPSLPRLFLYDCPELESFAEGGLPSKLENLNIWCCKKLNVLSLHSTTLLSLVEVTIYSCPNFVCFQDGGLNAPNLRFISVQKCPKLRSLPQHMHNLLPSLRQLIISDCPELESFPEGGLPSKLESLYICSCKKLIGNRMQWGLPTLTSLEILSVNLSGCEQVVDSFPDEGLLPPTLSGLNIFGISKLDGKGFTQLTSLKQLVIHNCPELQCLPDEGLPTSLSYLHIEDCPLLEQRYQRETGEDWPKIAHIKSIHINNKSI